MRKRVGIARALIAEPEMLLFDEPTAGLDPTNSRMVARAHRRSSRRGVCDTAIVVTHDLELAETVADRMAILHRRAASRTHGHAGRDAHRSANPVVQALPGRRARED